MNEIVNVKREDLFSEIASGAEVFVFTEYCESFSLNYESVDAIRTYVKNNQCEFFKIVKCEV